MILIKKVVRISIGIGIISLFFSHIHTLPVYGQEQPEAITNLTAKFAEGKVLKSLFQHQVIDSFTHDTTLQRGEIWLTSDAYKIRTETTTLLINRDISRVYDKLKNRVIISEYDPAEDDFAPSQLLTDIYSRYKTSVSEQKEANNTIITLISDDIFSTFKKIHIHLKQSEIPTKIIAIDQADNKLVTTFHNPAFITSSPGIFQLVYPDNTDIVDLRP